jgi:hypothetical protein
LGLQIITAPAMTSGVMIRKAFFSPRRTGRECARSDGEGDDEDGGHQDEEPAAVGDADQRAETLVLLAMLLHLLGHLGDVLPIPEEDDGRRDDEAHEGDRHGADEELAKGEPALLPI